MPTTRTKRPPPAPKRWYLGDEIPMSAIRKFARAIAEKFQPEKIILFGSQAYGTPNRDSDVDILVIMPAWNESSKAGRIRSCIDYNFPLDLIVRTPENMNWRLREGDFFLREITSQGKVLYEKPHARVGAKGRKGPICAHP
jgi:predicted nucleotidyltransferase